MTKEKIEENKTEVKKEKKPLFTSRVLFISVLDKIYIAILFLALILGTLRIFNGNITSLNYNFWERFISELALFLCIIISYLLLNWIYKCFTKTMISVTEKEIYIEKYLPFKRSETSIALNKVTGITTYKFFWIFRFLIIHQYSKLPIIFWTWTNQEFKDVTDKLINNRTEKIENKYADKSLITKEQYGFYKKVFALLAGIILLIGIVRLFAFIFNSERNLAGTYSYKNDKIVLKKNGKCNIDDLEDNVTSCMWSYDKETKKVVIEYTYKYTSFFGSDYESDNIATFTYEDNILKNKYKEYKKEK